MWEFAVQENNTKYRKFVIDPFYPGKFQETP